MSEVFECKCADYPEDRMVVSKHGVDLRVECFEHNGLGEPVDCAAVAISPADQERLFQFLGKALGKEGFE